MNEGNAKVGSSQAGRKPSKEELEEDWDFDIQLHNPRFPRLVRDFLDSGVLANLIKHYGPKRSNSRWTENHKDLVLIAFCAMELGCTLPPGFLGRLKANYHRAGIFGDEREQIRRACDEYVDGKPYEFVSLGLVETAMMAMDGDSQRPEPRPPGLEPLPAQEINIDTTPPARKRRKTQYEPTSTPIVEEYCLHFPADTCANCGATRGHETPDLKRCKGCKTTLYCFDGCQKWHWFRHRRHCTLAQKAEDSADGKSIANDAGDSKEESEEATT